MKLSLQSQLILYPLTIRQDKKHYIVEESLSGEFFEMPKVCIDAIQLINQGESLAVIEQHLIQTYPDDDINLVEFAEQLLALGLIKEVDGEAIRVIKKSQSPKGFMWIPSWVGQLLFNKITSKLFVAVICINILLAIIHPGLLPEYQDIFLFDSMMLNVLMYMAITLVLIVIHEFGHILAVRSYNLPAKLEIGNRLLFIVFETDLSPAWKLKPQQRNRLYTAGMCFDQMMLFIAFVITLSFPEGHALLIGISGIVTLDIVIKIIYQCCFYMKTDLYYLVENITGCYNLMENGRQYLCKWLPFIKKDSTTETFVGEVKVVRMYGVFYICGVLLTLSMFAIYFIPQALYAYSQVLPELLHPVGNPYFWDAVVFLGQTLLIGGLLVYSWMKNRGREKISW
ncbi:peptidase [Virgibacillus phasianinus]|uniref:Peptidase n=1 Tax=Virgibacillus phasianinus TaxID=2017483 RepID=A0A220U7V8_9BACI|nr:peptidase [Virgibacillus phasianinus]ASK64062.1 peptidase [Virgibacillus phasianinus]